MVPLSIFSCLKSNSFIYLLFNIMLTEIKKKTFNCNLCSDEIRRQNVGNVITVGIGGCRVGKAPHVLKTILGSCVGITLYDASKKVRGLIHVMLPDGSRSSGCLTKFANTGIPNLVNCFIYRFGSQRSELVAKMFGGARMFNVSSKTLDIGTNNINASLRCLKEEGIRIESSKTGGSKGSHVFFNTIDGKVIYKTIGGKEEVY